VPAVLVALVSDAVAKFRDDDQWNEDEVRETEARLALKSISSSWDKVLQFLSDNDLMPDAEEV
jgi:hypothetical protein